MNAKQNLQSCQWRLKNEAEAEVLFESLNSAFTLFSDAENTAEVIFYDSFPWQLWFAGHAMYRQGNRLYFCAVSKTSPVTVVVEADISGPTPRFWWEFPEAIAVQLKPLLKLRALLPVMRYTQISQLYALKNEDEKTVARLSMNTYHHEKRTGPVFFQTVVIEAVRGYNHEYQELNRHIAAQGLEKTDTSPLHACFSALSRWPVSFSAKPELDLSANQISRDVLCDAIKSSLYLARQCETGIFDDIDTEFLHDYRVCIRSIRAMLGQLPGVLPVETETSLRQSFSDLGGRTNRLRDLDVYLLEESRYKAMVPACLQDALGGMFDDFRKQRNSEQAKLQRFLNSKTYASQIKRIESMLEKGRSEELTELGGKPVIDIAHTRLSKQYRKVTKLGRELHQGTEDEAIHNLRLKCKKLRYLLEFFASLFDRQAVNSLLKALRKLQNTLGEFNDLSVQQESLYTYYMGRKQQDPMLGMAVGALIGIMHQQQDETRQKIVKLFDSFDTQATRRLFDKLMHSTSAQS